MVDTEFNLKLIREIESRPCLYDFNLSEYQNKDIITDKWEEVARETGTEVSLCKEKWKNIRTVFARYLKKGVAMGSATYYLFDYLKFLIPFMKNFEFVEEDIPVCNDIQFIYTSSVPDEEYNGSYTEIDLTQATEDEPYSIIVTVDENEIIHESKAKNDDSWKSVQTEQIPAKNRKQEQSYKVNNLDIELCSRIRKEEEEGKKEFLLSLVPDLNSMNYKQTRYFKRRVLEVINKILDEK